MNMKMPSISVATEDDTTKADIKNTDVRSSPTSSTSLCLPLKRKRPPTIEIPQVLQEIHTEKLKFHEKTVGDQTHCFDESEVGVFSMKGKKRVMEDTHKIVSTSNGQTRKCFFGVYDGHGGTKAAEFVAENLHGNILEIMDRCVGHTEKEDAIKAAYLKTDQDFAKQGLASGTCCVTALIEEGNILVSNLGDCRAVLCRDGMAEVLTKDHRAEQEDERKRVENKGGYVDIHRGAWRVHGILSVSRSIGDVHLKEWVMAEPDTRILQMTPDMEFLVLASDGLWEKVDSQEVVDTATRSCLAANKQRSNAVWKEDDRESDCENVSPPFKARKISQIKQQKVKYHSSSKENGGYHKKSNFRKDETESNGENLSPSSTLQKTSQQKMKIHLQNQENNHCWQKPASSGLMAACKELVNLAVNRGSLDDVTVMIINLKKFQCQSR